LRAVRRPGKPPAQLVFFAHDYRDYRVKRVGIANFGGLAETHLEGDQLSQGRACELLASRAGAVGTRARVRVPTEDP